MTTPSSTTLLSRNTRLNLVALYRHGGRHRYHASWQSPATAAGGGHSNFGAQPFPQKGPVPVLTSLYGDSRAVSLVASLLTFPLLSGPAASAPATTS